MGYTAVVRVWTMVEVCFVPCKILLYLLTFVCIEKSVYILFWFVGSYGGSDVGGLYSSSYGGDYMSRGSDVGSSVYSSRGMGGSGYMGSGGSGSYY